jgi:hypothetical protein
MQGCEQIKFLIFCVGFFLIRDGRQVQEPNAGIFIQTKMYVASNDIAKKQVPVKFNMVLQGNTSGFLP